MRRHVRSKVDVMFIFLLLIPVDVLYTQYFTSRLMRFSTQATLKINGDIIFAYKNIPAPVTSIGDKAHPVKIGLSDAYIIDRTFFCEPHLLIFFSPNSRCFVSDGTKCWRFLSY